MYYIHQLKRFLYLLSTHRYTAPPSVIADMWSNIHSKGGMVHVWPPILKSGLDTELLVQHLNLQAATELLVPPSDSDKFLQPPFRMRRQKSLEQHNRGTDNKTTVAHMFICSSPRKELVLYKPDGLGIIMKHRREINTKQTKVSESLRQRLGPSHTEDSAEVH